MGTNILSKMAEKGDGRANGDENIGVLQTSKNVLWIA